MICRVLRALACRRSWARALRTPGGMFPNVAIDSSAWGER
jgi:hypothetical protein